MKGKTDCVPVADLIGSYLDENGYGAQNRLAKALGVEPSTVGRWRDSEDIPAFVRAPDIAEAISLDPEAVRKAIECSLERRDAANDRDRAALRRRVRALEHRLQKSLDLIEQLGGTRPDDLQ